MKLRFPDWLSRSLDDPEMPQRLFLVFLLVLCPTHGRITDLISVEIVVLATFGLLVPRLVRRWEYWVVLAALLTVNLWYSFQHAANHYFLTIYTCLALAAITWLQSRGQAPRINLPRALLIITFGFAGFHKVISEYFMSGRLLASYFLRGKTFRRPLEWIYPDFSSVVSSYRSQLDTIAEQASTTVTSVPITVPSPNFSNLCVSLALGIGVGELLVFGMLAWNRAFYSKPAPFVLLAFIWGTFLFRNELTFFSILCILSLMSLTQAGRVARLLFAASASTLLALSLNEVYLRL